MRLVVALLLALSACGPAATEPGVGDYTITPAGPQCPTADEIQDLSSISLFTCSWFCVRYEGQVREVVSLEFQLTESGWAYRGTSVHDGTCP